MIELRDQYDQWVIDNVPPTAVEMGMVETVESFDYVTFSVAILALATVLAFGFWKKGREV